IRLVPGDHEIRIATPAGMNVSRRITLTSQDTGSQQTMTIPFERVTSQPPQTVQAAPARASAPGKRWAAVGPVVLLLAVPASAAYVFVFQKSRPQPAATSTSDLAAPALAQPDSKPADKETASGASPAAADPAQKSDNANQDELKKTL